MEKVTGTYGSSEDAAVMGAFAVDCG